MAPKSSNYNLLVISDIISPIDDDDEFGLRDALSKPARRLGRKMQTKTVQKLIKKRYDSDYENKIMLELEKLKNGQIQHVKVDLTKINIRALASRISVLSEDVKLYMKLLTSKRYYALNDRTINLLMKGDVDMSATTGEEGEGGLGDWRGKTSDSEVMDIVKKETKVEIFIVGKNKTSTWIILSIS